MKSRIATFLIALFMLIAGTSYAVKPVIQKSEASKAVTTFLKQELKYPKFAKKEKIECYVLVRLIINDNGTFTVDCINCTCPLMKADVTSTLENFSNNDLIKYAGEQVNIKLNYKLI